MDGQNTQCIAFDGTCRIALGPLADVAVAVKQRCDADPLARILVFNAETSELVEIDCRGSVADVLARIAPVAEPQVSAPAGRGRPKLGVVAREVTLLPRHWDWLAAQPGGASVALRKLVEQARRLGSSADRVRTSQNVTDRFMTAMAGDLDGYEEVSRALFAGDRSRFEALLAAWPEDIRAHMLCLAEAAFLSEPVEPEPHA